MCEFFSCIVTKKGEVFFTEENSHEEVIKRSGFLDDEQQFVRIEYTKTNGYTLDEQTIPEWYERIAAIINRDVKTIFDKIAPARGEYEKIEVSARKEYEKIQVPAWKEYGKIRASAREEYEKIQVPAREEYGKIRASAWKEYEKIEVPSWEEYEKIKASAWEEYEKIEVPAREEYGNILSKIKGYINKGV